MRYNQEIKLRFQVVRVSCKPSFTFFSLMATDVIIYIQCIGILLMWHPYKLYLMQVFNLSLFRWLQCHVPSDCLSKRLRSRSSNISITSFRNTLHLPDTWDGIVGLISPFDLPQFNLRDYLLSGNFSVIL